MSRIAEAKLRQRLDRNPRLHLIQKVRPRIWIADRIAGIDLNNGLERSVVDAQPHRLIIRLNHVHAALVTFLLRRCSPARPAGQRTRCTGKLAEPELMKPGPNARQRPHETAGAHQLPPRTSAGRQIAVKPLLVDFLHVQKPVRRPRGKSGILNFFAQHASPVLFTASKKTPATVMLMFSRALAILLPDRNRLASSPPQSIKNVWRGHSCPRLHF